MSDNSCHCFHQKNQSDQQSVLSGHRAGTFLASQEGNTGDRNSVSQLERLKKKINQGTRKSAQAARMLKHHV